MRMIGGGALATLALAILAIIVAKVATGPMNEGADDFQEILGIGA